MKALIKDFSIREDFSIDFLSAIEITSDIIFFTDKSGDILYVNPSFEKITGYTKEEVIGKNPRILKSGEKPKVFYEKMWAVLLAKQAFRGVVKNKKKDGDFYYEEKTIVPIYDKEGNIKYFTSSGKDITERINYENRLTQLVTELERANKELENFNRIVAHDLKNPLSSIIMASDLIFSNVEKKLTDEEKKIFMMMQNEAKYMNKLIQDLLEYAKVGYTKEDKEQIDLNVVVKEIIEENLLHPTITFKINNTLPIIVFNKTHIRQVFENLISNSVKYMDKAIGEIKIGSEEQENSWKFYVADNGSGIDEKFSNKIFQPFVKAHNRKDIESTGIGLSIVKKIIEMAGGKIWFESEIGKGSTFYFEIPKTY